MFSKIYFTTAFSFLLMGGGAFAADATNNGVSYKAPILAPTPVQNWEGAYLGAVIGRGFSGKGKEGEKVVRPSGFIGSVFAGYNLQNGSLVYGGEGDIGFNGMKGEGFGITSKGGVEGSIRARLGYAVTDSLLLYTTAGAAAGRSQLSEGGKKDSQTFVGWTAGAGADAMLTENVFARAEYRFTHFGDKNFDLGSGSGPASWGAHRVGLGIGIKF